MVTPEVLIALIVSTAVVLGLGIIAWIVRTADASAPRTDAQAARLESIHAQLAARVVELAAWFDQLAQRLDDEKLRLTAHREATAGLLRELGDRVAASSVAHAALRDEHDDHQRKLTKQLFEIEQQIITVTAALERQNVTFDEQLVRVERERNLAAQERAGLQGLRGMRPA